MKLFSKVLTAALLTSVAGGVLAQAPTDRKQVTDNGSVTSSEAVRTLDIVGDDDRFIRDGFFFRVSEGVFFGFEQDADKVQTAAAAERGTIGTAFGSDTSIADGALMVCSNTANTSDARNTGVLDANTVDLSTCS